MDQPGLLGDLITLFGLGVVVVLLFHRLKLPPIVGFLVTGVLCGPYGFGLIQNAHDVDALAEVGVILLLFTVGIEFSVEQLLRMRTMLLAGGSLQVALTLGAVAMLARLGGEQSRVAIFLGMLVALSSTAIVLRSFAERGEMDSPHAQSALAILIFQDLCIVPMVLLTPLLSGRGGGASMGMVVLKAVVFIAAAVGAARYVVPWILHQVVSTRRREIFLLTIILLCLGTAWASARVGLSLALGAFIAGLVVSESEYSHQALGEMLPLREVFNSLFFVSIGMLFDVRTLLREPLVVLGAVAVVVAVKALLASGVVFALGQPLRVAMLAGLAVAQIGEFSFVLSRVGLESGLLDARLNQLFLAAAVLTMAASPALMQLTPRLAGWLERRTPARWSGAHPGRGVPTSPPEHLDDHVIIVGYGINGRNLARVLGRSGIPFVVVDTNPETVRAERRRGRPIIYGDATRPEILQHAGIARARVIVIAISDPPASRSATALARRLNSTLHIVVRSRYVHEMEPLMSLGANEVVPEEFETSVEIFARVLQRFLLPRDTIDRMIADVRKDAYQAFRTIAATHAAAAGVERLFAHLSMETYRAEPGSAVDGVRLGESGIRERSGATVIAIQRADGTIVSNPTGRDAIGESDAVLLLGQPEQLAAAAAMFRRDGR